MKIDVSGSKDRTSNLKHEQHSYAFFASLHNLSKCEQIQTRTKPCDVLWTLLGMKIVRWEQEMKSRMQRVMPSCLQQLPMIDFDFMGPGIDNISWLWSNACQCTLKSDFSSNMHFIRIGVLSLIESECWPIPYSHDVHELLPPFWREPRCQAASSCSWRFWSWQINSGTSCSFSNGNVRKRGLSCWTNFEPPSCGPNEALQAPNEKSLRPIRLPS